MYITTACCLYLEFSVRVRLAEGIINFQLNMWLEGYLVADIATPTLW